MEKLEKHIYSVKYLPQILYFGSLGLLGYDIYCNVVNDTEFIPDLLMLPFTIFFLLNFIIVFKSAISQKIFVLIYSIDF